MIEKLQPQLPGCRPFETLGTIDPDVLSFLATTGRLIPQDIEQAKVSLARALERYRLNKEALESTPPNLYGVNWCADQISLDKLIRRYKEFFLKYRSVVIDYVSNTEIDQGFGLVPGGTKGLPHWYDSTDSI